MTGRVTSNEGRGTSSEERVAKNEEPVGAELACPEQSRRARPVTSSPWGPARKRREVESVANNRLHVCLVAVAIALVGSSAWLTASAQPPPPSALQEFVPVDQLPAAESLPAAPLVIAAYAVAWVAILGYLWSVWKRLGKVERELADVTRRMSPPERKR